MAQSFRFLQIHAVPIPQLTKGELQEALQNVTAQVGGAFKPSVVVKRLGILPSLIGSLSATLGRNPTLSSLEGCESMTNVHHLLNSGADERN